MPNMYDIDLSKIPNEDPGALGNAIESFYKNDNSMKAALAYSWERSALFIDGLQWLIWSNTGSDGSGSWQKLDPSPANKYIPRPVTNYIFDAYQTLKSYLLKNKPRSTVRPNTQTHRDKAAAKIAELIIECNFERLKEAYNYEYAASCLTAYGTVFKKDYWDSSFANVVKVPRMKQVPVIDPLTGVMSGMQNVQESDETGQPVFDSLPLGDVYTAIVEPYRIVLDPIAINLHEARWIMEYSIRPLSWIRENYDKQDEGYTGLIDEVKEEKSMPNSLRRFFQLRTSSGVRGTPFAGTGMANSGSPEMLDNSAVVKEYYERPSANFPKGRLIVVANNITLYAGDSPYEGPEQGDWHPYSECRWELSPGRFWGKSAIDHACDIQKQINSIDSVIVLTRKTAAVPQMLIPHTAGVTPGSWTGEPGQMRFYRDTGGRGPEIMQGAGVHQSVFEERAERVESLKTVTGAIDILKGDRPPGVTAASALEMLYEVGTGKLFPILDRWKMFIESSQKKQLRLIASKYKEPRDKFIAMLISRNKELTEDQLKNFIGQDLNDNCNVVIEAASSIPKLKAAEHLSLMELANLGVLNLQNPANRTEFLQRFGISGFDQDYSKDVKRAEWENDLIDNMAYSPDNKPVMLQNDNHAIHIEVHGNRTKEPSFMALPIEIQKEYFAHMQEHEDAQAQQEQLQAMKAAAMGMPPEAPAENPMHQQQQVSKGKGISVKMQEALNPDIGKLP